MAQVRVNLSIEEGVWGKFSALVPRRQKSRIINDLLKSEVDRINRRIEEGELAVAFHEAAGDSERLAEIREWEPLDTEEWG